MPQPFLTADWNYLAMVNYEIEKSMLLPFLPAHTELDSFEGKYLVSLVAFRFWKTKILGISVPFHTKFEEINLRFYVKRFENDSWKRGVVFIREIVPKRMVTFIANRFYGEKYVTMPTRSIIHNDSGILNVNYQWGENNFLSVKSHANEIKVEPNSKEDFIAEHYWGYARINHEKTKEYKVEHARWKIYPVISLDMNCDFQKLYGEEFSTLKNQSPHSVLLAKGSPIKVYGGKMIG